MALAWAMGRAGTAAADSPGPLDVAGRGEKKKKKNWTVRAAADASFVVPASSSTQREW